MDTEANEFQRLAVAAVDRILADRSPVDPWESRKSRGWTFFVRRLLRSGNTIEIYVYPDAMGLSFNEEWYIYEWPDYKANDLLLQQFFKDLGAALEGKEPLRHKKRLLRVFARMLGIKRSS